MALIAVVVLLGVGSFGGAVLGWFSKLANHITTT
jgi:Flp pilus assembly pilin Flp